MKKKNIMKKIKFLLLMLLFFNSLSFAQTTITWYRIMAESTLPVNPTLTTNVVRFGYYNINPSLTSDQNIWGPGATNWSSASLFGAGGGGTNVTYNITIPNCTAAVLDLSPELFGAIHQNLTFAQQGRNQAYINTNYPGIGATVNDYVDWAAWQMAVRLATTIGGGVKAKGPYYFLGNKRIFIARDAEDFQIDGNGCMMYSDVNGGVFNRMYNTDWTNPDGNSANINQTTAESMSEVSFTIKNFRFYPLPSGPNNRNQSGVDAGPSKNAYYLNLQSASIGRTLYLRFARNTLVQNCYATAALLNAFVCDRGYWQGATSTNSSSDNTVFSSCRTFNRDGNPGLPTWNSFHIIGASGVSIENCIVEGGNVNCAIFYDYDGNPNAKDLTIRNTHFECDVPIAASGNRYAQVAILSIEMNGGIVTIDKMNSQYAAIVVQVNAPNPAPPPGASLPLNVSISNISWVVKANNLLFRNFYNLTSWTLVNNDGLLYANAGNTIASWFDATGGAFVPQPCGAPGCGPNRYYYVSIPR